MASPTIALLDKSSGTGTSASFANATVSGRGQLVVLFLASGHSALNVPSGWTAVPTLSGTSVSVGTIYVYWIRRGGSEPAKTWTWTGSVYWEIYPFEYNGIVGGAGSFVEAVSVGTPTTGLNPDAPSVTTLSTDTLVNALYFQWSGWGGGFMQPPIGYTEITGDSGFDTGLAVKAVAAPGAEDPGVATGAFASDTMWGATFVVASQTAGGPTISAQPSDAHVHVGATASFSVTAAASGGGTLSYQWKKNGTNVSGGSGGTTASYTTPTLTQADDGALYTCDVTETGGSSPGTTPSASATLRVGVIYVAAGAIAYSASGGTSVAPAHPAGVAANDLIVLALGQKPSAANGGTATTPASPWALAGSLTGANDGNTGGYTTTLGADTGNCNIFGYSKVATGSESGTLSVTVGTNGVCWAQMLLFRAPPGATWSIATTTGKDTSAGNLSITGAADPGVDAGDYVVAGVVIPTDVTTPSQFSAEAFSQTGVTFGTVTEFSEPDSTTGNDIGGVLFGAPVSTGPSSAAPTWTATAGGTTTNVRGPGVFMRLRATSSGGTTDGAGSTSLAVTTAATGASTGAAAGSSSVACTTSAVGASVFSGAGSAALTVTASAVGATVYSAAGTASAAVSCSAVGAAVASGVGSCSVAFTALATGAAIAAGAGSCSFAVATSGVSEGGSFGSSSLAVTAAATGTAVTAAAGSTSLVVTTQAAGASVASGVGATFLTVSVSAVGAATSAAAGSVSTAVTVSGAGASLAAGAGQSSLVVSVSGSAESGSFGSASLALTATAVGTGVVSAAGSASLAISASASGASTAAGSGSVSSACTVVGSGRSIFSSAGAVSAVITASAVGQTLTGGSSAGLTQLVCTVSGSGAAIAAASATASLAVTASAAGNALKPATGAVSVSCSAAAVGSAVRSSVAVCSLAITASAAGAAIYEAVGFSTATLVATAAGTSTAASSGSASLVISVSGISAPILPEDPPTITRWSRADAPSAANWARAPGPTAAAWVVPVKPYVTWNTNSETEWQLLLAA